MKRIAVFGGAFNPPTIAHQLLANYVLAEHYVSEVWLMPCYKHRFGKRMVDFNFRLEMCGRICSTKIVATNFEKIHKTDGSYEMLKELAEDYKTYHQVKYTPKFYMIIGQDNADEIKKWKNWKELIEKRNFIVFPRKYEKKDPFAGFRWGLFKDDEKGETPWYMDKRHIFLKDFEPTSISSTLVRRLLKEKDSKAKEYLDPEVYRYIKENRLYR
jgi:nicotinate-nucleotide adenylyltransferase